MPKHAEPALVEVETSVTLPMEHAETGQVHVLQPGSSMLVDPEDPAVAGLMDVYLHRVRAAD